VSGVFDYAGLNKNSR